MRYAEGKPHPSKIKDFCHIPFVVTGALVAGAAFLHTDHGTRLCSASSATGSAEQRGPKGEGYIASVTICPINRNLSAVVLLSAFHMPGLDHRWFGICNLPV